MCTCDVHQLRPQRIYSPLIYICTIPDKDKNGLPDDIENDIDSQVLKDVGLANTMGRSTFLSSGSTEGLSRSASLSKSIDTLSRSSSPRTPGSLRREGRRIGSIGDAK